MSISISLNPPSLQSISCKKMSDYFNNSWELYEWLFSSIIDDETYYLSPDPLRNPLVFYFAHTAAFYINKLKLAGLIEEGINSELDHLFAVGVDPSYVGELDIAIKWPTMIEARAYRKMARQKIENFITHHKWPKNIDESDPEWAFLMSMEHDRIHFETSSVLIRQLPLHLVQKPRGWKYASSGQFSSPHNWIKIDQAKVTIGQEKPSKLFAWDNEVGSLECDVAPFAVTDIHVTNSQFLIFVEDGGYSKQEFWSSQGWEWLQSNQLIMPKFWRKGGDNYLYRAMFDEFPLPQDWPAEVVCYEAMAYCKWLGEGCRLMTEAEWKFLANHASGNCNLNLTYGSPRAADLSKNTSRFKVADIMGNVWDWVSNDFYPLPQFKAHPFYTDFSLPFFDKEHGMMLGGSWASTGTSASKNYRLWFRRNFIQHAGFRVAISLFAQTPSDIDTVS